MQNMAVQISAPPLLGRERQLGMLRDLVDRVAEQGAPLVIRGDDGIGKSALLPKREIWHGLTG